MVSIWKESFFSDIGQSQKINSTHPSRLVHVTIFFFNFVTKMAKLATIVTHDNLRVLQYLLLKTKVVRSWKWLFCNMIFFLFKYKIYSRRFKNLLKHDISSLLITSQAQLNALLIVADLSKNSTLEVTNLECRSLHTLGRLILSLLLIHRFFSFTLPSVQHMFFWKSKTTTTASATCHLRNKRLAQTS